MAIPSDDPHLTALLEGWQLHIQVDKIFHSSPPFFTHSATLRRRLAPIFTRLPIRPFFLAHIGYELSLDSLLIQNNVVDTALFYHHITNCDPLVTQNFLKNMGITNPAPFSRYLRSFIDNRYLEGYIDTSNIVASLDHIGKRVWQERFNEREYDDAKVVFQDFLSDLQQNFMEVFEYIEKNS